MKTIRQVYLVVKIKSLAAEAVIIRRDEQRYRFIARSLPYDPGSRVDVRDDATQSNVDHARIAEDDQRRRARAREAWSGLAHHRRFVVRPEARCSLLAQAYLRGVAYHVVEQRCHEAPDWARVARLVARFGECDDKTNVQAAVGGMVLFSLHAMSATHLASNAFFIAWMYLIHARRPRTPRRRRKIKTALAGAT